MPLTGSGGNGIAPIGVVVLYRQPASNWVRPKEPPYGEYGTATKSSVVTPLNPTLSRCPWVPVNRRIAFWPAVGMDTVVAAPSTVNPAVVAIVADAYLSGTGVNFTALAALPAAVATVTVPAPADSGTVTVRLVDVAALTRALVRPNATLLLPGVASKPAPVMVTSAPAGA